MSRKTAIDAIRSWRADPVKFVRELFGVEPDDWQIDVLNAFAITNRIAMKACKGPGKTCVLAWCCWNFLLCYPNPKIAATSISADNLSDGLWAEMSKWQQKSKLLTQEFTWTKTRIYANAAPETWFMSFRAWSRSADQSQQADTLAGLHADYIMFVIDEAGSIPQAVMAAAEAALANEGEGRKGRLLIAGNPARTDGPLYMACTRDKKNWFVVEISSAPNDIKRTPRVSKEWAQQQIDKYGADNPWVLVNVFGHFPPSSLNSLLTIEDVRSAMGRKYGTRDIELDAMVLGVDVAAEGDDSSVIAPRKGLQAMTMIQYRNLDGIAGADATSRIWNNNRADACFVDNTGGFGSAWIACLKLLGKQPVPITFSSKPIKPIYANKRAEMYDEMANWIKGGGALPNDEELLQELCAITYTHKADRLILEDKELIKQRIGRSPDKADALALTFAMPVEICHDEYEDEDNYSRAHARNSATGY